MAIEQLIESVDEQQLRREISLNEQRAIILENLLSVVEQHKKFLKRKTEDGSRDQEPSRG